MSASRTTVTELATALGALGAGDADHPPETRPAELVNVSSHVWESLLWARREATNSAAYARSWASGNHFLWASGGLRGRPPVRVEWKGDHRPVGYEMIPVDLRLDHVFQISCKDNSQILFNGGPHHLFARLLADRTGAGGDWFVEVDAPGYDELYLATREHLGLTELPAEIGALTHEQRGELKAALSGSTWPAGLLDVACAFFQRVATRSAERWRAELPTKQAEEVMFWRLIRLASGPYFLLGESQGVPLRLRVGTPWDWRQAFEFIRLDMTGDAAASQAVVRWSAEVRSRQSGDIKLVDGHVEVRWSKGKFYRSPEAKVYLDSPHSEVPGYFSID